MLHGIIRTGELSYLYGRSHSSASQQSRLEPYFFLLFDCNRFNSLVKQREEIPRRWNRRVKVAILAKTSNLRIIRSYRDRDVNSFSRKSVQSGIEREGLILEVHGMPAAMQLYAVPTKLLVAASSKRGASVLRKQAPASNLASKGSCRSL